MIVIGLMGGLGNQMFQYAIAKQLSIRLNSNIFFDYSFLENSPTNITQRNYELGVFFGKVASIPEWQFSLIKKAIWMKNIKIKRLKIFPSFLIHVVTDFKIFQEKGFKYDPQVTALVGNLYLIGFWQTEKYFRAIEKQLRVDFTFPDFQIEKNINLAKKIGATTSVGVHIRRGDYITKKNTQEVHGNCSMMYYQQAINYIKTKTHQPFFFIFSDDPKWCKANLKITTAIFVDWNKAENAFRDMHLMSLCQHNITANSTFSWWGAWLNQNPNKIVIAPNRWFANENMLAQCGDLIPDKWIKM